MAITLDNVNLYVACIKIVAISFLSSLKNHIFGFFLFTFNIHDLQYWAKELRQFCNPVFGRDGIIKSSVYKRELNLVPSGKIRESAKLLSKE